MTPYIRLTDQEFEALATLMYWTKFQLDEYRRAAKTPKDREEARAGLYTWKAARRGFCKLARVRATQGASSLGSRA